MRDMNQGIAKIYSGILVVMLISLLHAFPSYAGSTGSDGNKKQQADLVYFYLNPCGQCDEAGEFWKKLDALLGKERNDFSIGLSTYNTFKENDKKVFDKYCRDYSIPREKQKLPILFINGRFLTGKPEIEANLKDILMAQKQMAVSEILYFHVTACGECDKASKFLDQLDDQYTVRMNNKTFPTMLSVQKRNVEDAENLEQVRTLFRQYGVPEKQQEVPVIFFKGGYLSGEEAIRQSLVSVIEKGKAVGTVTAGMDLNNSSSIQGFSGYQAGMVFLTGLLNGLNPCSVSMLLFFASLILVRKYNILKLGMAFILGKLIAYTLLGTFLFSVLLKVGSWFHSLQGILKLLLILLALLLAVVNLSDYLAAKNERYGNIRLQLPGRLRKANHALLQKLTSSVNVRYLLPASFILGVVISAGEFLCTGQIYLATIVYIMKKSPVLDLQAIAYFLLYGIALVLPLSALTLLIHKGRELFDVSEFVRSKMHIIKMANVLFFLIFIVLAAFLF